MAASRRPTKAQQRERRARVAAVVLGVGFLAVAVIQGPKLLKMIQGSSSSSTVATSNATSTSPGLSGTATTISPVPGAAVAGLGPGQLSGFSLFNPVVPFKPIPKPATSSPTSTTSTPGGKGSVAAAKTATTTATPPTTTTPTTTNAKTQSATTTTTPAPPVTFTVPNGVTAAVVTVNGKKQLFGAGATFPQEAPLFKLHSIAKKGLKIGVLGGTFVNGQPYLVLQQGHKVTLLNQTDGTKFVIVYVKKMIAPANELTSPTQTTTTPAAPATTAAAASTTTG